MGRRRRLLVPVGAVLAAVVAFGGVPSVSAAGLPQSLPEADRLAAAAAAAANSELPAEAEAEAEGEAPVEAEGEGEGEAPVEAVAAEDPEALIAEAIDLGLLSVGEVTGPVLAGLVAAVPTVGSVRPSSGPLAGGQVVVISGKDWGTVSAVEFGAVAATSYAVASATQIVARVPNASAGGVVAIEVTNGDGSNATGPNYTYIAPEVSRVSPLFASDSTSVEVTITGKGFTGAVAADVKFGTFEATEIWVVSDTQIVASSPIDDGGNSIDVTNGVVDVTVTRNSVVSAASAATKFLFTPGLPTVTGLTDGSSAVTGTGGVAVAGTLTVTGTNLWGASVVNFGTVRVTDPAAITVASDGASLTVTVPNGKPGPVEITVENVRGTSGVNLSTRFTYLATVTPRVSSVTPSVLDKAASGGGGTMLVTGTGFSGMGTSQVTIKCASDVTPTAVLVVSDTAMIVTAPGNADTAAVCDLKVDNVSDNTKTFTAVDVISYV